MMPNSDVKIVHGDTFDTIMSATNKMVDFIAPTYGPAGNKVIIDKNIYRMVVDDGVQIARDFVLDDEAENAVVNVIRQVAIKTNDRVGDGTTSSLIMLRAIMNEIAKLGIRNGRKITEELKKAVEEAKTQLLAKAKTISSREDLERVARISFDNPHVAKLIADLLFKIGKDGVVTMDISNTMETTSEYVNGIELKQGYISPYMITDPTRMESQLDKPYIILTTYRLTNANDLLPAMNLLLKEGKRELIVIADNVESDCLATLLTNRMKGAFNAIAVQIPPVGDKKQYMEDLATLMGATLFTEDKGNRLESIQLKDFGRATKAVIRQENTVISGAKGIKSDIEKAKSRISDALALNPKEGMKDELETRLARLSNKVAVVKVGASTDAEQKALKYKVEDAINATKAALKDGIVCGSGLALSSLKTSSPILNKALKVPFKQLLTNMGIEDLNLDEGEAYNVVSEQKGPFMKVGVIDPVAVLIAGIESAVSIASILVTCHGILVQKKPKNINNQTNQEN